MTLISMLLLAGGTAATALGAEYSVDSNIQIGPRFDSNPRYQPSSRDFDSAWGTLVDVRLPLLYRTERTSISLDPRLAYSFYNDSGDDDLQDRNKYLTGTASWSSRLSSTGVSYGFTDLALRTSEFQGGGAGGSPIFSRGTQQRWYLQPYWQYQFSPANSITANGGYEEVTYDQTLASRRFDYDYTNASISFQHALNERHSVALQAQLTQFNSGNADFGTSNDSQTNSLNVIYTYALSERTVLSATLGWANTKSKVEFNNGFSFDTDSSNFVGNLTATHQTETIEYEVVLGQSISPNSNGSEVLRFDLTATANKTFSERFSGRLRVQAFTQNSVGGAENLDFNRDFVRGDFRLNYKFTRHWSIYSAYSYTFDAQKRFLVEDYTVRNHYVSMGIKFNGDGWRW